MIGHGNSGGGGVGRGQWRESDVPEFTFAHVLRFLAVAFGVCALAISIWFNLLGFEFNLHGYTWLGIFAACLVTVLQAMLRNSWRTMGVGLFWLCFVAYVYSVTATIYGFYLASGSPDVTTNPLDMIIPVTLGLIFEISPEWIIVWGIGGESSDKGWVNKRLFGGRRDKGKQKHGQPLHPLRPPVPANMPVSQPLPVYTGSDNFEADRDD